MEKLLCPSLMCCDVAHLADEVHELDEAGVDIYHMDVMDGIFVENMELSLADVRAVRSLTKTPVDVHLMVENPSHKVDWFLDAGVDIVYIHPESESQVSKTLRHIQDRGKAAGIVLDPDTTIAYVSEMLRSCDYVLVMTVEHGFAGQSFLRPVIDKIKELIELKSRYHYKIMVDGACSPEVIEELSALGVDGFILGTSALFGKDKSYAQLIKELRAL